MELYSRHYAQEALFILALFTKNTIHNNRNTYTIHIHTIISFLLLFKSLPMKVRP